MKPKGEVVVSKNDLGQIVLVSRQDKEGRILSIIAEAVPEIPSMSLRDAYERGFAAGKIWSAPRKMNKFPLK